MCERCDEGAAVRALCESCSSTLYGQLVTRVLCGVPWFECCDEVALEGFVLATRVALECGLVRGRATVCESSAVHAKGEQKFDVLCDERVWCASRAKVEGHGACVQEVRPCVRASRVKCGGVRPCQKLAAGVRLPTKVSGIKPNMYIILY